MRIETDRLIIRSIERDDFIPCTIVLKSTGDIVGNIGCTYYEDTDKVGICYFAGAQFRKKDKRLGKYISLEYYGFPKRDNANRLDQKRLNIISKRDIIGDSGIGRLLRRENGVPLSYGGMFVDTTNQHDNHI